MGERRRSLESYKASLRVQTELLDHLQARLAADETNDATRRYLRQRLERTAQGIRAIERTIELLEQETSGN
jgi:hypothetical protein